MNEVTVWITRTLPGAEKSATAFQQAGFRTVVAPLLKIGRPAILPRMPEDDAVLIFTSGNGVDAFCNLTQDRHWPVVTVGDATAQRAGSEAFRTVHSAAGDWADVVKSIRFLFKPDQFPIRHIGGQHVRGRIVETLAKAGYDARLDICYRSWPVHDLPELDWVTITHIALYSPMAAHTLAEFSPNVLKMTSVSISPATDAALEKLEFADRLVAMTPDEPA
ncbi:MAG: uroporphyrinogen-III synthase, partial [Hyphomonadaceae bacterium]|nr:uroporphyrinogen-III synthase [Hyphomonadaceae bacterium]